MAAAAMLVALLGTLLGAPPSAQAGSPAAPKPAPDFTRPDLDGHSLSLASYRGKLVLLNFWATWCEPCMAEIGEFSRWQQLYGAAGLQIIGVSMDDDARSVRATVQKYQLGYPVVMGDARLGAMYGGVLGLPLSFLIDAGGNVVRRIQGETDLRVLEATIKSQLPEAGPAR